jgi:hypothetical protein
MPVHYEPGLGRGNSLCSSPLHLLPRHTRPFSRVAGSPILLHHGAHDQPTPIQDFASVGSWLLKGTQVLMLRRLMGGFLRFGLLSHFASWLVSYYSTSDR